MKALSPKAGRRGTPGPLTQPKGLGKRKWSLDTRVIFIMDINRYSKIYNCFSHSSPRETEPEGEKE